MDQESRERTRPNRLHIQRWRPANTMETTKTPRNIQNRIIRPVANYNSQRMSQRYPGLQHDRGSSQPNLRNSSWGIHRRNEPSNSGLERSPLWIYRTNDKWRLPKIHAIRLVKSYKNGEYPLERKYIKKRTQLNATIEEPRFRTKAHNNSTYIGQTKGYSCEKCQIRFIYSKEHVYHNRQQHMATKYKNYP